MFQDLFHEAYGAMRHNRRRTALTMLLRGIADVSWPATSLYDHSALTVLCAPEVIASESVREAMRRSRAREKAHDDNTV